MQGLRNTAGPTQSKTGLEAQLDRARGKRKTPPGGLELKFDPNSLCQDPQSEGWRVRKLISLR